MNKDKYDIIILIGMGISAISSASTIASYVLSQFVPEIFTGVMNFSFLSVFFGAGLGGIGHKLSIAKPTKRRGVKDE